MILFISWLIGWWTLISTTKKTTPWRIRYSSLRRIKTASFSLETVIVSLQETANLIFRRKCLGEIEESLIKVQMFYIFIVHLHSKKIPITIKSRCAIFPHLTLCFTKKKVFQKEIF